MRINMNEAAKLIRECDNAVILLHESPDGDTMGSGFALCRALRSIGKRANVLCSDELPPKFSFMYDWYSPQEFEPQTVIAADIADKKLMGSYNEIYGDKVQLCVDHHISNTGYAEKLLLGERSAAACEVVYSLLKAADIAVDDTIAMCLYTGIATDTGCFKFENVTSETHRIVSELYNYNVPFAKINRHVFDIKSRGRIMAEQLVMSGLELHCGGKCAVAAVTGDMIASAGLTSDDFDGIASLPMQIEGVEIGITIKEKNGGGYKVSVRSAEYANASALCAKFGGGGHIRAAGCAVDGTLEDVKKRLSEAAAEALTDGA